MNHSTIRGPVSRQMRSGETRAAILALRPKSAADIRHAREPVVRFSFGMQQHELVLRTFLRNRVYSHSHVNRACAKAEQIVKELFAAYMEDPKALPPSWQADLQHAASPNEKARTIADYIAGMTDRYAVQEHRRLFAAEGIG